MAQKYYGAYADRNDAHPTAIFELPYHAGQYLKTHYGASHTGLVLAIDLTIPTIGSASTGTAPTTSRATKLQNDDEKHL